MNIAKPISRSINSDAFFLIDPLKSVYRTADIFLNEIDIETNYGFTPTIFNSLKSEKNYTYAGEFREQTIFTSLSEGIKSQIADFYIRKSPIKYVYKRSLGNLLLIVSYLGGIWSSSYLVIKLVVGNYAKKRYINNIANKIYNYPSQISKKKSKNDNYRKNESHLDIEKDLKNSKEDTTLDRVSNIIKDYLRYERKLIIGFFEMFKLILEEFLCFKKKLKSEKSMLLDESEKVFVQDIDIFNILRRLHELEKIKELLFTENQKIILDYCPKPNIDFRTKNEIIEDVFISPGIRKIECSSRRNVINQSNYGRKSLKRLTKKKPKTLLEEKQVYEDYKAFQTLIQAWKSLKNDADSLEVNKKLITMLGEQFATTFDFDDQILDSFVNVSKSKENLLRLLDLVRVHSKSVDRCSNLANVIDQRKNDTKGDNYFDTASEEFESMRERINITKPYSLREIGLISKRE